MPPQWNHMKGGARGTWRPGTPEVGNGTGCPVKVLTGDTKGWEMSTQTRDLPRGPLYHCHDLTCLTSAFPAVRRGMETPASQRLCETGWLVHLSCTWLQESRQDTWFSEPPWLQIAPWPSESWPPALMTAASAVLCLCACARLPPAPPGPQFKVQHPKPTWRHGMEEMVALAPAIALGTYSYRPGMKLSLAAQWGLLKFLPALPFSLSSLQGNIWEG